MKIENIVLFIGILALGSIFVEIPEIPEIPGLDIEPVQEEFVQEDIWETFAQWVETQDVPNTDYVLNMAKRLEISGVVADISRLDSLKSENRMITSENRSEIANLLRGD